MVKRFWFTFSPLRLSPLNLGCGITAYDYNDALALLKERVFKDMDQLPQIVNCIEDVDISTLDRKHVRSNMGSPLERGVWFPMSYN